MNNRVKRKFTDYFETKNVSFEFWSEKHILTLLKGRHGYCRYGYVQGVGNVPVKTKKTIFGVKVTNMDEIKRMVAAVTKSQNVKEHLVGISVSKQSKNPVDIGKDVLNYMITTDEIGQPMEARIDTEYTVNTDKTSGIRLSYEGLFRGAVMYPDSVDDLKDGTRAFTFSHFEQGVQFVGKGRVAASSGYRVDSQIWTFPVVEATISVTGPRMYVPKALNEEELEESLDEIIVGSAMDCREKAENFLNMDYLISKGQKDKEAESSKRIAVSSGEASKKTSTGLRKVRKGYGKTVRRG